MGNKTELILIRISGVDRPGLTASVTAILSKYQVDIMDIGQADIHSANPGEWTGVTCRSNRSTRVGYGTDEWLGNIKM